MTKHASKSKVGADKWFLVFSVVLAILLIGGSIFSIIFISNRILQGFNNSGDEKPPIEFNLDGYKNLNLAE